MLNRVAADTEKTAFPVGFPENDQPVLTASGEVVGTDRKLSQVGKGQIRLMIQFENPDSAGINDERRKIFFCP